MSFMKDFNRFIADRDAKIEYNHENGITFSCSATECKYDLRVSLEGEKCAFCCIEDIDEEERQDREDRIKRGVCPECDGRGTVQDLDYGNFVSCPECNE